MATACSLAETSIAGKLSNRHPNGLSRPKLGYLEEIALVRPGWKTLGAVGFFQRARKVSQMGKQAAELKGDHPKAWAAGEEMAIEALQGRSDDLVQMLIEGPEERVEQYRVTMTENLMEAIDTEEFEAAFETITEKSLTAFGISMGMKIVDVLQAERKARRREV